MGTLVSDSRTYVFARREEAEEEAEQDGGGPSGAAPAAMAPSALVDAAAHWRSSRDVHVLVDGAEDDEIAPDHEPLLRELRALGLRTVHCRWTDDAVDWASVRVALPLGTWSYADSHANHERFCAFYRRSTRRADLVAARWGSHKRCSWGCGRRRADRPDRAPRARWRRRGNRVGRERLHRRPAQPCCQAGARLARRRRRAAPASGDEGEWRNSNGCSPSATCCSAFLSSVTLDGELCLVFVDGELLHAVHKDPAGAGARAADDDAAAEEDDDGGEAPAACARHVSDAQLVRRVDPVPPAALALAQRALRVAERCTGPIFLARVDLLRGDDDGFVVSELELGWPELFLRLEDGAAARVAAALLRRIEAGDEARPRKARRTARRAQHAWGCPQTTRWKFG